MLPEAATCSHILMMPPFSSVIFYINNCEILSSGGLPCGGSGCGLSDTHELDRILEFAKVIAWL